MIRASALALVLVTLAACTEHARDPAVSQAPAMSAPGSEFKDAATLFGLPAEDVNALFGEPRQTRRDGPA
jgi:hypothetical protein